MSQKLFAFLEQSRETPSLKPLPTRKIDFVEIYDPFTQADAQSQAERCLDCGNPYCGWECPVHNHIPQWLDLVANDKILPAAELCHLTNSLPEVCGRVCPQDRLCEGACTLNDEFGAVTIGSIEKYIVDTAFALGWRPDMSKVRQNGRKVAVIGAGPAGLACADVLCRNGVAVKVFDAYPEIGGLLTFGIPEFKLEKRVMHQRREIFASMGIEFALNTRVGVDISFERLLESYDSVFLGTGAYEARKANINGESKAILSLDYLVGVINELHGYGLDTPFIDLKGKRVFVLGGGDTAMDCTRTAIRQGAASVTCVYRRDKESMPGSRREIKNATEEGVAFVYQQQPVEILHNAQGVSAVVFEKTRMVRDSNNQTRLEMVPESRYELAADAVIIAFGFSPKLSQAFGDLQCHTNGRLVVSEQGYVNQTSDPRVFAGGDNTLGADLVVTAIAEGRKAAESMLAYMQDAKSQERATG